MITFDEWLQKKNITLRDWQKMAAYAILSEIVKHKQQATGKTFLLNTLTEFVNIYGNNFTLTNED